MAKEFLFDAAENIKVATKARIEGLRLRLDGTINVKLGFYDVGGDRIEIRGVEVTKTQADTFFNNFNAAGGGS